MRLRSRWLRGGATFTVAVAFALTVSGTAQANVTVKIVSTDPYINTTSFHSTEVEPDTFAFGTTIVGDFQAGRFVNGGASNIGWVTSTDSGRTWMKGFFPSTTIYATPPGPFKRVTDPAIGFDPKHNVWLAVILASSASGDQFVGNAVLVSRSTDGGLTWGAPVTVKNATGFQSFDSTWISCDTWAASPNFGNCYVEWDDNGSGNVFHMSRSLDGGLTWTVSTVPGGTFVIGGKPSPLPNGTVVVPIDRGDETAVKSFVSTDGGASYTGPFSVSSISRHLAGGDLRTPPISSAEVDASGKVYVVWADCRFRSGCSSNDIVMSTSTNGMTWTAVTRIPIDDVTSGADHFLPGIGVDPTSSGATARLGIVYNFYPVASCSTSTCQLDVGFISSADGGATWGAARQLSGPMALGSLPNTSQGPMVGDYNSASFIAGQAHTVYPLAKPGTTCTLGVITSCKEAMTAPRRALSAMGPFRPAGLDRPVPGWRAFVVKGSLQSSR